MRNIFILVLFLSFSILIKAEYKWTKQMVGTTNLLTCVDFLTPETGLVIGSPNVLFRTTNGGVNWTKIDIGTLNGLSTVTFVNKSIAFISGEDGVILKSIDGGLSWNRMISGVSTVLYSINFVDENIGYAAGLQGIIIKTTDGGNSWTRLNNQFSNHIYRISFLNKDTGFVAARDGLIARTINAGASWEVMNTGTTNMLTYFRFIDNKIGYAVGDYGTILRTEDTGTTWKSQNSGSTLYLNCVKFIDQDIAYIVGKEGLILKTTNRGQTWANNNSGTTDRLVSLCFPSKNTGYAVGDNGTILKLSTKPDTIFVKYCASEPDATLSAVDGYSTYNWLNNKNTLVHSGQVFAAKNPADSTTFACIMSKSGGILDTVYYSIIRYEPKANFTAPNNCKSNTVQFTNLSSKTHGTLTYKWNFGDGSSTDENPIHTFSTSGLHQVSLEVSNSPALCTQIYTNSVETFVPTLVGIDGASTYCEGYSTTLKAHGADHYKWSMPNETTDSIHVATSVRIWLLGYSANGCVSDTIFKSITKEPDISLSIEGNHVICSNDGTQLNATGAKSYLWNTNQTDSSIVVKNAGTYTVSGWNTRGCEFKKSFEVIREIEPIVDFSLSPNKINSRHNEIKCEVPFFDGVEYKWEMGDQTLENGNTIQHFYNVDNAILEYQITLKATTMNGCEYSASKTIEVIPFVPNVFTPNGDDFNALFMPDVDLQIVDRNGIVLYKGTAGWDGSYNGHKANPDTYFYLINYPAKNHLVKTIKGYVTLIRE